MGMRASYYLLGALLGKYGNARVALPGGCNFGVRPIDQHLKGFEALGAETRLVDGAIIEACCDEEGLVGTHIYLDVVSVGATMNIMLAASRAKGLTVIENAAKEPHIVDLANFLNSMGADVRGAGTDVIKIRGVSAMHGITYSIIPDQIEAGTYMCAAAATRGKITITNITPKHLESISAKFREMGVKITEYDEALIFDATEGEYQDHASPGLPDGLSAAVHRAAGERTGHEHRQRERVGQPLPVHQRADAHGRAYFG